MMGLITILFFVVLLAVPGFYIITRKVFPRGSKKSAMWVSILLTVVLVVILVLALAATPV